MSQPQSPLSKPKQVRDPPPSLFLGPPSRNASQLSLPGTLNTAPLQSSTSLNPTSGTAPLMRQRSQRLPAPGRSTFDGSQDPATGPSLVRKSSLRKQISSEGQKQAARTDALWAEMQSTLEEVELSAVNGTHVFGPEHSKALEELRTAQIGLAQAWARSEADDAVDEGSKLKSVGGGILGTEGKSTLDGKGEGTEGAKSTIATGSGVGRPGSSSGPKLEQMGSNLEDETKADIVLARNRREANDRYFQRVNAGVLDVVAKLEEVAAAMRSVEQESRDIWGENDSVETGTGISG